MVSNLLGFNLNIDAKTLPPLQKTYFLSSKTHKVQKTLKHQSYGSKTLNQSTFSLPSKNLHLSHLFKEHIIMYVTLLYV